MNIVTNRPFEEDMMLCGRYAEQHINPPIRAEYIADIKSEEKDHTLQEPVFVDQSHPHCLPTA